jgi:predicted aconitase with swiveling domain
MHKLQLRGQLLYLNGTKQTLLKTEAHNTRNIPIELDTFGHIDPNKTHLNHEIVSLHGESLEGCVLRHIS